MPREFYYADFLITMNTNQVATGPQFTQMKETLRWAIEEVMAESATLRRLFNPALVSYRRYQVHIEQGHRVKFVHVHFTVTLKAKQPFRLHGLNRRLQAFFADVTGLPGVYVSADLTQRAKRLNYVARKDATVAAGRAVRSSPRRITF